MLLAKMKVLDSGYLDLMEPRLTSVYHRVSRTAEKKESADQADKFMKVGKISLILVYNLMCLKLERRWSINRYWFF